MIHLKTSVFAFVRLRLLGMLVILASAWGGGQGIYTAIRNPKPTVITVADYEREKPRTEWIEFKDAYLVLADASYSGSRVTDTIKEVYIPIRSSPTGSGKTHILLDTKNAELLKVVNDLVHIKEPKDATAAVVANLGKLIQRRDVSGLVQFGVELKDKKRTELLTLNKGKLADDFVLVSDGEMPQMAKSIGLLAFALVVAFIMFRPKKV